MSINGSVGRAKAFRRMRREQADRAKAAGIDPADRPAVRRFNAEWSKVMMLGIGDRARCRCSGVRHARITGAGEG